MNVIEKEIDYATPELHTTDILQDPIIGIRPDLGKREIVDGQCQCSDCDTGDCGPNNPGS
ncbi:MAG: hypothetical protein ACREFE_19250 [Limisphaerales bacterium]